MKTKGKHQFMVKKLFSHKLDPLHLVIGCKGSFLMSLFWYWSFYSRHDIIHY